MANDASDDDEDLLPEDDEELARMRKIKRLLEERLEQKRLREELGLFEDWEDEED